ncbi:MAG: hypothetical protein ACRBCI_14320 [Cellvibrionaceae bacterium]
METIPHIQELEVLLDSEKFEFINTKKPSTSYSIMSDRLKRLSDGKITQPEIIFIDSQGREFRPVFKSIATTKIKKRSYKALGFGTNPDKGKFIYPKDVKFTKLKIKSNTNMVVSHLRWIAYHYFQAPNATWDKIAASEIVNLK